MSCWDRKERASICDLERYGLSLRVIDMLEKEGILFIDQLRDVGSESLLKIPLWGDRYIEELRQALLNWTQSTCVKTVSECVEFPDNQQDGSQDGQGEF